MIIYYARNEHDPNARTLLQRLWPGADVLDPTDTFTQEEAARVRARAMDLQHSDPEAVVREDVYHAMLRTADVVVLHDTAAQAEIVGWAIDARLPVLKVLAV